VWQKDRHSDVQGTSQLLDRFETDVVLPPLDQRYERPVMPREVGQLFLGYFPLRPDRTQSLAEPAPNVAAQVMPFAKHFGQLARMMLALIRRVSNPPALAASTKNLRREMRCQWAPKTGHPERIENRPF
jgi:hypothetical protein